MISRKKPDWQSALDVFLAANRTRRFSYGTWDCCLFACDAVEVMTGIDLAEPFRGRYTSGRGAREALRETIGSVSVRAVADRMCGLHDMPRVETLMAQRGDLALVRRKKSYSLGIVALTGGEIVVVTAKGLELISMDNAAHAWRI